MIKVRTVTSVEEWDVLAEKWDVLLRQSRSPNVFLTWEWLHTWWDYYGTGKELLILIAEDDNEIRGIAPFYIGTESVLPGLTARVVRFLGDEEVGSDFLDFIVNPGNLFEILDAIVEYLWKEVEWDLLHLESVDGTSPCPSIFLTKAERKGAVARRRLQNVCPYIRLADNLERFDAQPDVIFKKIIRKNTRKLQKKYPAMRIDITSPAHELTDRMKRFFAIHTERWAAVGQGGIFRDVLKQEFYQKIAKNMTEKGWLCLSCLWLEDQIEVMEFCLSYENVYYAMQLGRSEKASKHKGGNILTYYIIKDIIGRISRVEYLRGDELYKYYLGCENHYTLRIDIAKSFKGRMYAAINVFMEGLRTTAKFIFNRGS